MVQPILMNFKDVQLYLSLSVTLNASLALKDSGSELVLLQDDTLFITLLTQTAKLTHMTMTLEHVRHVSLQVYEDYHQTTSIFSVGYTHLFQIKIILVVSKVTKMY